MELITNKIYVSAGMETFAKQIQEFNLVCFASEAAREMEFEDVSELQEAVKRSMELFLQVGIPIEGNFKQIYKCAYDGIEYDWKLSFLAYQMVCLNGGSSNSKVARMQIELLKNQYLNR